MGGALFLERLRAELEEKRQEDVAAMVTAVGYPMKQPRVSELVRLPIKRFRLAEVQALARALGVNPAWLAFGEGPRAAKVRPAVEVAPAGKPLARPSSHQGGAQRQAGHGKGKAS